MASTSRDLCIERHYRNFKLAYRRYNGKTTEIYGVRVVLHIHNCNLRRIYF